jgi:signal transduction histidine kinase
MLGIADRVDAVEGTIELESPPGAGTTITIRIPLATVIEERRP